MEHDKEVEKRKERISSWFGDRYNLALVSILIIAFAVRLYYMFITKDQTLWWDEAEYMATAKHWVLDVPYDINPQRPPLFQLIAAVLLFLGASEIFSKFVLSVVPSTFLVFCIYLVGKEMFNKKIGLFAALASSFIWAFLFWSSRFQPDYFSMSFQMLSILFFWKLFKNENKKYAIYAGLFAALGFYFKISALLVPLSVFVFVIFKEGFSFVKNKYYWLAFASFVAALIPFMIWSYISFGNPIAFAPSYSEGFTEESARPLGWMTLNFLYIFPKSLFFILFLAGAGLALFNMALMYDVIIKNKEKRINPEIFSLIVLIVVSAFYIFYIQGTIEDRWVFLLIPFSLYFSGTSSFFLLEKLRKYGKGVMVILLIVMFSIFIYTQLQHTTQLIDIKKDSYLPVKEAALWLKERTEKDEKLLSISYTQSVYYSERNVSTYSRIKGIEEFDQYLQDNRPRFLQISIFEPHPPWINEWIQINQNTTRPVQAYFADAEKQKPVLIVYEILYQ